MRFASSPIALSGFRSRSLRPVTKAGFGYAGIWTSAILARCCFSYGSAHWFGASLGRWLSQNDIAPATLIDGLIFMAIAMLLVRVLALSARRLAPEAATDTAVARASVVRAAETA